MRADNSQYVIAAARRRAELTRARAIATLRRMDATGKQINFDSVAREAGVARSWLYTQDDIRTQIQQHRERHHPATPATPVPARQRASDASLLRRLQAASDRIRRLETENRQLRDTLCRTLGQRRANDILGETTVRDTPNRRASKVIGPC
jgi:uncharacterized protein DUF6262